MRGPLALLLLWTSLANAQPNVLCEVLLTQGPAIQVWMRETYLNAPHLRTQTFLEVIQSQENALGQMAGLLRQNLGTRLVFTHPQESARAHSEIIGLNLSPQEARDPNGLGVIVLGHVLIENPTYLVPILSHEIRHAQQNALLANLTPSLFHGSLSLKHRRLPSFSPLLNTYPEGYHLSEIPCFARSLIGFLHQGEMQEALNEVKILDELIQYWFENSRNLQLNPDSIRRIQTRSQISRLLVETTEIARFSPLDLFLTSTRISAHELELSDLIPDQIVSEVNTYITTYANHATRLTAQVLPLIARLREELAQSRPNQSDCIRLAAQIHQQISQADHAFSVSTNPQPEPHQRPL